MTDKEKIFREVETLLYKNSFSITGQDDKRPWGGFLVIEEAEAKRFAEFFFPDEDYEDLNIGGKLSPKILIVAPHKRLSWQYHNRRAEIWKCIKGKVDVLTSDDDNEKEKHILQEGTTIKLKAGERHRLIGLSDWGVVAEIWQHTDAANPSDEDDIIRLQDDFGRK